MSVIVGKGFRACLCVVGLLLSTIATEPAYAEPPAGQGRTATSGDDFKRLIDTWKSRDAPRGAESAVSVPLDRPVESFRYTSPFGVRTDPFRGVSSFHAGVDLAAPVGTPVHATGDALVVRAGTATGYGNVVMLDHGGGIETRYGHLSRVLVTAGQRVRRGDVIGLVGSTGRSTGSHLHYEIRLADQAINPLSFMVPGDERLALNDIVGPRAGAPSAMGGPQAVGGCTKQSVQTCGQSFSAPR